MDNLEKFRICRSCKRLVPATKNSCDTCGRQMNGIAMVKTKAEAQLAKLLSLNSENAEKPKEEAPELVRVCPVCHTVNPGMARKCQKCHEDISDVERVPENHEEVSSPKEIPVEKAPALEDTPKEFPEIMSLDGKKALSISSESNVIGREGLLQDYLDSHAWVSRRHAEILIKCDGIYIKDLNSTNGTFVDGTRLLEGEEKLLTDNAEIGLGDDGLKGHLDDASYFRFHS